MRRDNEGCREEMEQLLALGLRPVRGVLLYGKPGCGKTALVRELCRCLNDQGSCPPPKIVSASELLDRWVGGSEKAVRHLFADAEAEYRACHQNPAKSALHIIVIDEIDAVFRKRCSVSVDSGDQTRASVVNQILAKIDGVEPLDNILVVGLTNRRELVDAALTRPGRLEVLIEIPLPDRQGRHEILQIHFGKLRRHGRLSQPLCDALDGVARNSKRKIPLFSDGLGKERPFSTPVIGDLSADRWTGGMSGADLAGLVRCSASFALARLRLQGDSDIANLFITLDDVARAMREVRL
jgi:vesicle-fusing ATPase